MADPPKSVSESVSEPAVEEAGYPPLGWHPQNRQAQWQIYPLGHLTSGILSSISGSELGDTPSVQAQALRQAAHIVGLPSELGDGSGFTNFVSNPVDAPDYPTLNFTGDIRKKPDPVQLSNEPIAILADNIATDSISADSKTPGRSHQSEVGAEDISDTSAVKDISLDSSTITPLQRQPLGQHQPLGFKQPPITADISTTDETTTETTTDTTSPIQRSITTTAANSAIVEPPTSRTSPEPDVPESDITASGLTESAEISPAVFIPENSTESLGRAEISSAEVLNTSLSPASAVDGDIDNTVEEIPLGSDAPIQRTPSTPSDSNVAAHDANITADQPSVPSDTTLSLESRLEPSSVQASTNNMSETDTTERVDENQPVAADLVRESDSLDETTGERTFSTEPIDNAIQTIPEQIKSPVLPAQTDLPIPPADNLPNTQPDELKTHLEPAPQSFPEAGPDSLSEQSEPPQSALPFAPPVSEETEETPSQTTAVPQPDTEPADQISDHGSDPQFPIVAVPNNLVQLSPDELAPDEIGPDETGLDGLSEESLSLSPSSLELQDSSSPPPPSEDSFELEPTENLDATTNRPASAIPQPQLPTASPVVPNELTPSPQQISTEPLIQRQIEPELPQPAAEPTIQRDSRRLANTQSEVSTQDSSVDQPPKQPSELAPPIQAKTLSESVTQPLGMHELMFEELDAADRPQPDNKTVNAKPSAAPEIPAVQARHLEEPPSRLLSPRLTALRSNYGLEQPDDAFFSESVNSLISMPSVATHTSEESIEQAPPTETTQTISLSVADALIEMADQGTAAHISSGEYEDQALWQLAHLLYSELRCEPMLRSHSTNFQRASPGLLPMQPGEHKYRHLPLALWPPPLHQLAAQVRIQLQAKLRQDFERSYE